MPSRPVNLRPYQREAIGAVIAARRRGVRRMVISLPTGAGKTVIFSELAKMARRQVLVLAHREELLGQARSKLEAALEGRHLVSVERGEETASSDSKVLVCSIRSLHEERLARVIRGRDFGLVIYDECHHAAAEDNMRVLRQLGVFNADWDGTLLGFTATTARGDGKGLNAVFETIAYSRGLPEMIDDGFLAPLRGFRIATGADLTRVSSSGQDFSGEELSEAVDIEDRNALVARSIQEARAGALADFRKGQIQVLANVAVLTEGFDDPGVSCIAMARPTRSEGLYTQCVGRGTRLHPGKRDCLILDFVDASTLPLCSLPSLFGVPRNFDLQGGDVSEAARAWQKILFDHPGFELEAGALTLPEIQERAAAFNPLTQEVHEDVRAISGNAWFSLGRHGLGLYFEMKPGATREALVLKRPGRGKVWEVLMDGATMARFSELEEAVCAVDYELERLGRSVALSALPAAPWRQATAGGAPPTKVLQQALWEKLNRCPPRFGKNFRTQEDAES